MKWFTLSFLLIALNAFGQPNIPVPKKDSCYKKAAARQGKRFTEWECGKLAGVVDCNEKLELDPGTNTVMSASSHKPFSGQCETCHMNGILERRVTFVDGKTQGVDTTYYPSGCIMVIRSHVQGVENGRWTYFFDSLGTVNWEMNYSVGQKHGPQITFSRKPNSSSGDTVKLETYNNGVLNGPKVAYSKGKRTKQSNYVNGLLEGPFLVYNGEGKIIEEITYKQGKRNGISKYYYDDGTLLRTESWQMDVKNGEFKTFYYQGFVQTSENYKKGVKQGWFEEYFPDQKRKRRALYEKDVLVEEYEWDESGRMIKSMGGNAGGGAEDDAVPGEKPKEKKKKEKKKKEKKPKKPKKGETPPPPAEGPKEE